ncbi:GAF domain-containing protein [Georgenia sp. TF02-10]|uniref:sensor histidine kinase n=1 Tax=Georgenia sp. TF02-10 TaxID=2917725 RepID=UPI001FA6B7F9|nr:GAF domain-containing protein [Georgenia sp. TF02-10]UNX53835.1 GAF domain-containing protein [Georgenia sp. TF02-10]
MSHHPQPAGGGDAGTAGCPAHLSGAPAGPAHQGTARPPDTRESAAVGRSGDVAHAPGPTQPDGAQPGTATRAAAVGQPDDGAPAGRQTLSADTSSLLAAALQLTSELDLPTAMQQFVERAARLTGARYAALGVLDSRGETTTFVQVGVTEEEQRVLGHPPRGRGVLGAIPIDGPLILEDLTKHPDFGGFPPGHPPMHSFLGVPVRVADQVFGRLYLAEKPGGFTAADAEDMMALAQAAAVAIENGRLYAEARNRERWISASQDITTTLLEGTEEEEALAMIAARVREVAEADTALIVLPSVGDAWACEIADGYRAAELIGLVFPPDGRARTVLREGTGLIVDSLTRLRTLRLKELAQFGPALYAPMMLRGEGTGVLILLRRVGRPEFGPGDLAMAESVARQAALALELAAARHAQDVAALLDERARIGRDLHDLAIQQLFATGMQLESARAELASKGEAGLAGLLEQSLSSVDESVRQIRSIVHSLREPDTAVVLVERLRREASLARTSLGYAPSLVIDVDGEVLADDAAQAALVQAVDDRVGADVADDVVAVVREGLSNAARHARAASVQVRVSVLGNGPTGRVVVDVEDDGVGVDPAVTRRSGLANLAARARRHGGTFSVGTNERGQGSLLSWQVPLS